MKTLRELTGCTLVVACARAHELSRTLSEARALGGSVALITDDEELVADRDRDRVTILEPEQLFFDGVASVEAAFDEGARAWLDAMFPGNVDGRSLGEVVWTEVFTQPVFIYRAQSVVLAKRIFDELRPSRIWFVGSSPYYCEPLVDEARRRSVEVREAASTRYLRRARRALRWPVGSAIAARHLAVETFRLAQRAWWRGEADERLAAAGISRRRSRPRLWVAVDPAWVHPMRFLLHSVLEPLERAGVPYGLLFSPTYGVPRIEPGQGSARTSSEPSLFDGTVAALHPDAVAQISGPVRASELPKLWMEWLRYSLPACRGVVRHCDGLRVDGIVASTPNELPQLMQRATRDVLLVLETRAATRKWIDQTPEAREVIFNLAAMSQNSAADHAMQRAGIKTVDFMHGYATEGNVLRILFRSISTYAAAWTVEQAERLRVRGSNRTCVGGYLPWKTHRREPRGAKPRVLVLSNYVSMGHIHQYTKYAKRLARAVSELVAVHGTRCDVRVRLHPYDDRDAWNSYFAPGTAPPLSTSKRAAEDLAWADIVIATPSSTVIEALPYGIPLLFHHAVVPEPHTLFGFVAERRWFKTGRELTERIARLLDAPDPEPERALIHACFGEEGVPKDIVDLLASLDPDLFANRATG